MNFTLGETPRPDYTGAACQDKDGWAWFALPVERDPGERRPDVRTLEAAHAEAEKTCVGCPIALQCAQYAFGFEDRGLWALNEWERFYLGGRGAPDKQKGSKTRERRQQALVAVVDRFGPDHELTRWALNTPTDYVRNPVGRPRKEADTRMPRKAVPEYEQEGAA